MSKNGLKYINNDDIYSLITLLEDYDSGGDEVQGYINTLILKFQVLLLDRYEEYGESKKRQEYLKKEIYKKLSAYGIHK